MKSISSKISLLVLILAALGATRQLSNTPNTKQSKISTPKLLKTSKKDSDSDDWQRSVFAITTLNVTFPSAPASVDTTDRSLVIVDAPRTFTSLDQTFRVTITSSLDNAFFGPLILLSADCSLRSPQTNSQGYFSYLCSQASLVYKRNLQRSVSYSRNGFYLILKNGGRMRRVRDLNQGFSVVDSLYTSFTVNQVKVGRTVSTLSYIYLSAEFPYGLVLGILALSILIPVVFVDRSHQDFRRVPLYTYSMITTNYLFVVPIINRGNLAVEFLGDPTRYGILYLFLPSSIFLWVYLLVRSRKSRKKPYYKRFGFGIGFLIFYGIAFVLGISDPLISQVLVSTTPLFLLLEKCVQTKNPRLAVPALLTFLLQILLFQLLTAWSTDSSYLYIEPRYSDFFTVIYGISTSICLVFLCCGRITRPSGDYKGEPAGPQVPQAVIGYPVQGPTQSLNLGYQVGGRPNQQQGGHLNRPLLTRPSEQGMNAGVNYPATNEYTTAGFPDRQQSGGQGVANGYYNYEQYYEGQNVAFAKPTTQNHHQF